MSQSFRGSAKKQAAEKALRKRPVLVLFYMVGCPHCEANDKAWKEAKKKVGGNVVEVDQDAVPDSEGVNGFPTMRYIDAQGKTTEISGEKQSGDQILSELGVSKMRGSRRHSLRRLNSRRNRKLRHRTLRNNVALA
jgi:hypothetical protein